MNEFLKKEDVFLALSEEGITRNMRAYRRIAALPAVDDLPVEPARRVEYEGEDKGFHYCSKCKRQAFNYEDGREIYEVLSDFCPWCGKPMVKEN